MPRHCSACLHPERPEIDKALLELVPLRSIAQRFRISATAAHRHKEHIPASLASGTRAREVARADGLLDRLRRLQDRAENILEAAEASGDFRTAVAAIKEARSCIEVLGKVTGQLFERHAHVHVDARTLRPATPPLTPGEERVLRKIAQRLAIRGDHGQDWQGPPSLQLSTEDYKTVGLEPPAEQP